MVREQLRGVIQTGSGRSCLYVDQSKPG